MNVPTNPSDPGGSTQQPAPGVGSFPPPVGPPQVVYRSPGPLALVGSSVLTAALVVVGMSIVSRPAAGDGSRPRPAAADVANPSTTRYVVRPGDTLAEIAQRRWGDPKKWRRIYDANRAVLKDPANLPVGIEIVLPR